MRRQALLLAFAFALISLAPLALAEPLLLIENYTIYDRSGNLVANGSAPPGATPSYCSGNVDFPDTTPRFTYDLPMNITSGDFFYISLHIKNMAINEYDNSDTTELELCYVADMYGFRRPTIGGGSFTGCTNSTIGNFTPRTIALGSSFKVAKQESVQINGTINTSTFLYPGNYSLVFRVKFPGSQGPRCQTIRVGITAANYFYFRPTSFNISSYGAIFVDKEPNPPFGLGRPLQYWNMTLNVTLWNYNKAPPIPPSPISASFTTYGCYKECGTVPLVICKNPPAILVPPGVPQILGVAQGGQTPAPPNNVYCHLLNATNSTCPYYCYLGINNTAYNFFLQAKVNMELPLGTQTLPPLPLYWPFEITDPVLPLLYAVPGQTFNFTTTLRYAHGYGGNVTQSNNTNLTWSTYDDTGALIATNSRMLLPYNSSLTNLTDNGTGNGAYILPVDFSQMIPLFSRPAFALIYLKSTDALKTYAEEVALPNSPYHLAWYCNNAFSNHSFNPLLNLCGYRKSISYTKLIYFSDGASLYPEVWAYIYPGGTVDIPIELKNPLSAPFDYLLSYSYLPKPFVPTTPIRITFDPSSTINVPQALGATPGTAFGKVHLQAPLTTPWQNYSFYIKTEASGFPDRNDIVKLNVIVLGQDVEIVAINKTPDRFAYSSSDTPNVAIFVDLRNNGPDTENASLNITIPTEFGSITYVGACNSGNITLAPHQVTRIGCPEQINVSLENCERDNMLVLADLSLLTGIDSNIQNNHRYEIITCISPSTTESVPEVDFGAFLFCLLFILFILRKKGKGL